jgi:GT2 family glycosyltransferase
LYTPPSVAVVILNWNGKQYLQQFLPSVIQSTYTNIEIIVADNSSTDQSLELLEREFPNVKVIRFGENFGFAKGYNEALRQVDSDYYVLLNSDVQVEPSWLEPMVALLEKDKKYAACQPKLLAFHDKSLFEYAGGAGGWIDTLGYPFARGRLFDHCEKDHGQYQKIEEIFWASGAALMIKRDVFHEAGGFDPFFFAHQEEIDLCWRIHNMGYKIFACPQAVVYHLGGGTLPKGNSRKTFLNFRNNLIMLSKNLKPTEAIWKIILRLLLDQLTAWKGLLSGDKGYFFAIQKAQLAFFRYWTTKDNQGTVRSRLDHLPGVFPGSIVWAYFIKKKKTFIELFKN